MGTCAPAGGGMSTIEGTARVAVHYALHPLLLLACLTAIVSAQSIEAIYPLVFVGLIAGLGALEAWLPARPEWRQSPREFATNLAIVAIFSLIAGSVLFSYQAWLTEPMAAWRDRVGLDLWPVHWPLAAQILLAYFASEFGWYWMHRAAHRSPLVWRVTGHGAHHSFHHLGAVHFSTNHPFEVGVLLLPMAMVELLFGAGEAAAGASLLLLANSAIAHSNLDLCTKGIGWLFTTNRFHIHHHSRVLEESNTNYGCSAIVWDRLFGTFSDAPTEATGIGDTEPGLWGKALLPFREPDDTSASPGALP